MYKKNHLTISRLHGEVLLISLLVVLACIVYLLKLFYLVRLEQAVLVYPLDPEIGTTHPLQSGDVWRETFRVIAKDMTGVTLMLEAVDKKQVNQSEGAVVVTLSAHGLTEVVELPVETFASSPLVTIELSELKVEKGDVVELEVMTETDDLAKVWLAKNDQLDHPTFSASAMVNDVPVDDHLLFRPLYQNFDQILTTSVWSWRDELLMFAWQVSSNRPAWVLRVLLVGLFGLLLSMGWFVFETSLVMVDQLSRKQRMRLYAQMGLLLIGVWVFV